MNTTLVILVAALAAYILTCMHQWRRLKRMDPVDGDGTGGGSGRTGPPPSA